MAWLWNPSNATERVLSEVITVSRERLPSTTISNLNFLRRAVDTRRMKRALTCVLGCLFACQASQPNSAWNDSGSTPLVEPDLAVARAPFDRIEVDWKQRIDQPYVFIEARGSYTGIGRLLERAWSAAREQGLEISGPPFALYYDDPGRVAIEDLRMRACIPLDRLAEPLAPLAFDVLESTTVVYAFVAGPYPEVPRAYPKLFDFMARMNWREHGPIRETYLRNPSQVSSFDELVTEIQIPAAQSR